MKKINKNGALLILMLSACICAVAQTGTYQWQSPIPGLQGEGYYRLLLSPDVRARAASDGADLRLVDSAGNYVPYLLRTEMPVSQAQDLTVLPSKSTTDAKFETIIIENRDAQPLAQLVLTLRNKAQSTYAQLSGSDDENQWFDISSNIILSPSSEMQADTFDQQISFPPVKYKKLRLTIKLNKVIPINIIKAAIVKPLLTNGRYTAIPAPVISQRDSGKKTYVWLEYKEAYTIDRLNVAVSGSRFYHRQVNLYTRDTSGWMEQGTAMLSSTSGNEISVNVRTKHLRLVIENEDNTALQVQAAEGLQLNTYLIGYLDADRNYYVVFGNNKATRPTYDIAYFEDSIKKSVLKEISCGPISANKIIPNTEPAKKASAIKGMNKWWIWPVLIAILALLLYFTLKVSKDINRKP